MTTVPTLGDIATRLGKPEDVVAPVRAAEIADQASRCRVEPYNDALAQALFRRVARALEMSNFVLGVQMDEFGATRLGSTDPEVRRLEGPYRRLVVG